MSNEIEDQLRRALRPIDPNVGFADRVIACIESESEAAAKAPVDLAPKRTAQRRSPFVRWVPLALAASTVLSVAIVHYTREQDEQRGMEARRQLIEALRVTSDKLDAAYQVVNSKPAPVSIDDPGA
jgi:hypothetical protein